MVVQEIVNSCSCTAEFADQPSPQRRADEPRVITGNGTYKFLPGESMLVRRLGPRATLQLVFNCDPNDKTGGLPEVCENMCFGLNCLRIPNSFTRESNKGQCSANRKQNACGVKVPNPCSPRYKAQPNGLPALAGQSPGVKLSCDEFPFASTRQATTNPSGKTATRCVPAVQNSRQGGKIGGFYRSKLGQTDKFEILFDYGVGKGGQDSTEGPISDFKYCSSATYCNLDTMQMPP
ncbi:hypothetical protein B0H11DRAFT_1997216 [Mycena galericulata]|nr:hypothetical protein B0H11DRAFT_1997216 [Mycena galericulata]